MGVTVESVIYTRDCGTPHKYHDSKLSQLARRRGDRARIIISRNQVYFRKKLCLRCGYLRYEIFLPIRLSVNEKRLKSDSHGR
jgi:hypothetical protein